MIIDPVILLIAKLLISGLFLHSSIHKLMDIKTFRGVLSNYKVPNLILWPTAIVISVFELFIALSIIMSFFGLADYGIYCGIGLLGFYTALLSYFFLLRRKVGCGCSFGSKDMPIGKWHVARNLTLLTIAGLYLLPTGNRTIIWMDYITAIFAVIMIFLSLVIIENMKNNNYYFNLRNSA